MPIQSHPMVVTHAAAALIQFVCQFTVNASSHLNWMQFVSNAGGVLGQPRPIGMHEKIPWSKRKTPDQSRLDDSAQCTSRTYVRNALNLITIDTFGRPSESFFGLNEYGNAHTPRLICSTRSIFIIDIHRNTQEQQQQKNDELCMYSTKAHLIQFLGMCAAQKERKHKKTVLIRSMNFKAIAWLTIPHQHAHTHTYYCRFQFSRTCLDENNILYSLCISRREFPNVLSHRIVNAFAFQKVLAHHYQTH